MAQQPRRINTGRAVRSTSAAPAASTSASSGSAEHAAPARRKKKKKKWWTPLICVLVVIAIAVGGVAAWGLNYVHEIQQELQPDSEAPSIVEEIKTAEEYKGDVVNFLLVGVDLTVSEDTTGDGTNDGLTDMIMYVQFDVKNGKINMLQIPRNTYVGSKITCSNTTGNTYKSANRQINSIARSNATEKGVNNLAALADVIANNYRLPIDYYVGVDLDFVKYFVDTFGPLEVYVPRAMDYKGSHLDAGYQTLNGDSVMFLVRNRHGKGYGTSDIERLNVQRNVYAALFRLLRTCSIKDIVKLAPHLVTFMQTDCTSLPTIISLGVSLLKIDSADIMVCQTPVFMDCEPVMVGSFPQSVVVCDKKATTELLNSYFRTYTGEVGDLAIADSPRGGGGSTNANVQYMGQLDQVAAEAAEGAQ